MSLLISLRDERRKVFDKLTSDKNNVVEVFIKIIEIQQSTPICNAKFFEDIHKYYPEANRYIENDFKRNKEYLSKFLQNGIKQGYIREDLNVEVTAFLVEQSTYIYIRATSIEKPLFTYSELFYTMMINFVRGILTEKGIKIIDAYLEQQKVKK
jgi:hypothetical protein